jgi:hypothetical protein
MSKAHRCETVRETSRVKHTRRDSPQDLHRLAVETKIGSGFASTESDRRRSSSWAGSNAPTGSVRKCHPRDSIDGSCRAFRGPTIACSSATCASPLSFRSVVVARPRRPHRGSTNRQHLPPTIHLTGPLRPAMMAALYHCSIADGRDQLADAARYVDRSRAPRSRPTCRRGRSADGDHQRSGNHGPQLTCPRRPIGRRHEPEPTPYASRPSTSFPSTRIHDRPARVRGTRATSLAIKAAGRDGPDNRWSRRRCM